MGFPSGSVTFSTFVVVGQMTDVPDQAILEKLGQHVLRHAELGVPEEVEYGWSGGSHILDNDFTFDKNVFGDCLHFALRVDTNKVPGELRKAYLQIEENALAKTNPSGFISKVQKREAKDNVRRRIEEDLREGKYRRSKLVPVLWDFAHQRLHCPARGGTLEKLMEIFERSFKCTLEPMCSASLADHFCRVRGQSQFYEDLRPTRFVVGPAGDSEWPEYPWIAKGAEPKNFLGNEFLLWLWWQSEASSGEIQCLVGSPVKRVVYMFDKSVDVECAYGENGKDGFRTTSPDRLPEAKLALRQGKIPRKANLTVDLDNSMFNFTFNPETFSFGSTKLPDVEAETSRAAFEARAGLINDLTQAMQSLFYVFLDARIVPATWDQTQARITKWLNKKVD